MSFLNTILKSFLGNKNEKDLKEVKKVVAKIKAVEPEVGKLSDDGLRQKTEEFQNKIKEATSKITSQVEELKEKIKTSKDVDEKEALFNKIEELKKEAYQIEEKVLTDILPEAFAVLKETARRWAQNGEIRVKANDRDRALAATKDFVVIEGDEAVWLNHWDAAGTKVQWDMVHYDVQFIGGVVLHGGKIAEMATGEGKTLVGTLPIYLNALPGRGVHVVTVNDYLARRDSAWMGPLYEFHGLSIDCIDNHQPNSDARRKAYQCNITYGTNNEFGFDYLRDNMVNSPNEMVQGELNYAIVDEVDSVLIDDARTPLIISGPVPQGDRQEFDVLKPSVDRIVDVQKKTVSAIFHEAKKLIAQGNTKEGGFKLLQAYRGLPKNRQLIKFLSETGNKALLQKVEAQYMQDNNREMPKVDKDLYFVIDEKNNQIDLTDKGVEYMSQGNSDPNFFVLQDIGTELAELEAQNLPKEEEFAKKEELFRDFAVKSERIHTLNQLLKAYTLFEKDDQYVVMDGEVKIVDEQTGRIMEGRRYSDGLHQAIEAKENVKIEAATQTFATITLQNYFRMYNKLAGMTGTAETESGEFWEIYRLDVVVIPTNRPIQRNDKHDLVYKTNREKYNAVIEEVEKLTSAGRPVLVGTTSVEISQLLSKALQLRKIPHQVLNAKLHKKEAEIVAEAGRAGVVTIATNMAGRGTDIKLSKEVKDAGGLAIIGTERHDSRRVDRQLRGRAGRQGDPGSSQFYVSLEDNLMRLFGSERIAKMMDRLGHKEGEVIQHSMITKSIERAQKKVEENNFGIRKRLLEYDDVMNKQRDVIYKRRKNALFGDHLKYDIANMIFDVSHSIVNQTKMHGDYKDFEFEVIKYFTMEAPVSEADFKNKTVKELTDVVFKKAQEDYEMKLNLLKEKSFPIIENVYQNQGNMFKMIQVPFSDGTKTMTILADLKEAYETQCDSLINDFEKNICLSIIDENWKLHLREMDDLRRSSQGAVYEQKDPLVIYKQESFHLFSEMVDKINKEIISFLYKGEIPA
ncbi:preprotein translocase subunit SecA [Riemerella anatipestifer]|uniref:Protein translocase subunit SecA n=1 Tax=Riemerella anatipestifer (strain ATCC 11845 / DSM 15868 / JCM 9532 / NCTC 11014) TaxID=693978 RepID=E4TCJ1_RIEAD|nr:preprotein translocase subunit SecA [Riemerella anatipestifer]ADQ82500.1 protein translocase subunit secA [Riemerella anatipestifer ATCC 11845 = DSM 15868]ADZ12006.1 SecA [Riemerella anatipestifer RA-GD]AFD56506.1 protein translocase subunit seca [Riemerella anatipestifer ATCC 11845 = DSM 15868]AGC39564.1 Preprotein translocase subunit SecA (ATPase, RNA helicase) [Riemerella anatipestifer RA-CH-2]AKP69694.1 protein translocase subunit seca [Riemerella anatipestifer]